MIAAIYAHHAHLARELRTRTTTVVAAAAAGEFEEARRDLHDWYVSELLPHAAAEERALYRPASDLEATRLLVSGMIMEHMSLESLVAELAAASSPAEVAGSAVAVHAVFAVHLSKENDLLLPALDHAGVDLGSVLAGMHEILGGARPDRVEDAGRVEHAERGDLDVRTLPRSERHEVIFGKLDRLAVGEALAVLNDHDPEPLRYQISALWPNCYTWSYLESGPARWRVAITRVG